MNQIELYNSTAFKCSKIITKDYSTSFSLGIQTLSKKLHFPIYGIYGYVRYADEIVDTFHDYDKKTLLERFKRDTYLAIEEGISMNPVLHSFQMVVNEYNIERELIDSFLYSMEMDLYEQDYDSETYKKYIYGSAEVVGLMCLRVFCEGNSDEYDSLKDSAKSLGAAFQKVNFLRDMKSDFQERGRVYFPGVDFNQFDSAVKAEIEADIQKDFDHAYEGIVRLSKSAKAGVYLAYVYYLKLFTKIKQSSTSVVLTERIRVPDFKKMTLLVTTLFKKQINYL